VNSVIVRLGLEALYFSGAHALLRPVLGGVGAIFVLRHVRAARRGAFQPNRALEVTPKFLARTVSRLRRWGDVVSLDEMHRRLVAGDFARRFACITFDGGYRDIRLSAYPILKNAGVPFAIYVPTSFPDRLGDLWWLALEQVIAKNAMIGLVIDGEDRRFSCATTEEKYYLFRGLSRWLRERPGNIEMIDAVYDLAARYGVDMEKLCADECMDWSELGELAHDPLVTIGAQTVDHLMLAKLTETAMRAEIAMSRAVLESALGRRTEHLAYPYGGAGTVGEREFRVAAELGFKTAVTTQPGLLRRAEAERLLALPRLSLNGEFQRRRYLRVLMSGAATSLWQGVRQTT
jgi:peptidoglycan/xylan/chitin deacetylase (PgdA/CDA1 family)